GGGTRRTRSPRHCGRDRTGRRRALPARLGDRSNRRGRRRRLVAQPDRSPGVPRSPSRRRDARGAVTIEAVVFDFDGLILDTEGPVFTAWQEEFEAHGCPPLTVEEWAAEIGTTGGLDLVELIRSRATRPFDEDAMHARRRVRRDELLARETTRPGVQQWLDDA